MSQENGERPTTFFSRQIDFLTHKKGGGKRRKLQIFKAKPSNFKQIYHRLLSKPNNLSTIKIE